MRGTLGVILVSLVSGLIGGAISKNLLIPEAIVFAQGQTQAAKLVRAERIELVNKQGKPLAILEIGYSSALPHGAAMLTFNDNDELLHRERKLSLTTTGLGLSVGDDSAILAPGVGFRFNNSSTKSGGGIGIDGPTNRPTVVVYSPDGVATLDEGRLNIADKNGRSIAVVP